MSVHPSPNSRRPERPVRPDPKTCGEGVWQRYLADLKVWRREWEEGSEETPLSSPARPLEIVVGDESNNEVALPTGELPDATALADEQHLALMRRLARDSSKFPRFPWPDVDALTGALAPGEMCFLLGRTGQGKTLLLLNTFDHLVTEQHRRVLYIGTEQDPEILKIKWACHRLGIYPKLVLKPTKEELGSTDHRLAMEQVTEEAEKIRHYSRDKLALFAAEEYISRPSLNRWIRGAVKQYGAELVIIDHIDEVSHGPGVSVRYENTETLNLIQRVGRELKVPHLIASQCKRVNDRLMTFTPPTLEDLAENNNKERKASYVLAVWRPLRRGIDPDDLKLVRLGQMSEADLYERNEMGVKLLKTREDSGELGHSCRLWVDRGKLTSMRDVDRHKTSVL